MSFSNPLTGRLDELRFPNIRSPDHETPFTNGTSVARTDNPFFSTIQTGTDARGSLQRRFTTDSSKITMARPFGGQYSNVNSQAVQNKKILDDIQSAKRKAEEHLRLLEAQERSLTMGSSGPEQDSISNRFSRMSVNGPVSEPTTPPEYADSRFSNRFSRSSRLSTNSILSPPGLGNRISQTSSHITSPPTGRLSGNTFASIQKPSAKSMPGSRRGSDEEEDYAEDLPNIHSIGRDRYSMPVGSSRKEPRYSMGPTTTTRSGFDLPINTSFLDDTDNDHLTLNGLDLKSPIAKTFAQLQGDDNFPTLTKDGMKLSANSAAMDLANSKTPEADWTVGSRYRPAHQSMPHTDSSMYRPVLTNISSPPTDRPAELSHRKSQRHSMGVTFEEGPKYDQTPLPTTMSIARPTSLQTSYSTNDVPTVKKPLGLETLTSPTKTQAEQQFHNHNISLGRIPANGTNNRQSREMINGTDKSASNNQSALQASAPAFGPNYNVTGDQTLMGITSPVNTFSGVPQYPYNMQAFSLGSMTTQNGLNGNVQNYTTQNQNLYGVNGMGNGVNTAMNNGMSNGYTTYGKSQDVAPRTARRTNDEARFNNVPLESYRGSLYELCKDQHGCRYLQRKLEEGEPEHIQSIFDETCPHIIELMTDPFGNYLCQKLFEHCNDVQRSALINTAAPALAIVALNQHGTRALQKMIEFVHTPEQVDTIIQALTPRVVELVQDLNGNHVVQKCLTRLGAERCQFIYDAVGTHCVIVGTHRHGCCVLQRCIDHAQGFQRAQLIARITLCAFDLVQDPFGNYVVQYILDLDEPSFTKPLCLSFGGKIVPLSKQKFSSNVIEKCLRTADMDSKRIMIEEMMNGVELEKMLRDSFANYVVQTALEFADPQTKIRLIDSIRPILPSIKQTPHGRRIASKIMGSNDGQGRGSGTSSGQMTPNETTPGNFSTGRTGGRRQVQIVGGGFNNPRYANGVPAGSADNTDNGYTNGNTNLPLPTNTYTTMTNFTTDVNESPMNMFSPQGYGASTAPNGYGGFHNGQMGAGFI